MSDSSDNVVPLPSSQQIEAEAAAWLTVLGREQVTDEERAELKRWLRRSDRHRAAFESLAALWTELEVLKDLDDIGAAAPPVETTRGNLLSRRKLLATAASIAAALGAGGALYFANTAVEEAVAFATNIGEQRTARLSDGSTIQLNTDTRVEVEFTRTARIVRLERGEAYFEVAKDKRRAFSVVAGDRVVTAIGTAFTARRRAGGTLEVTVEEGAVALRRMHEPQANLDQAIDQVPVAQLTAGQSMLFGQQLVDAVAQMPEAEVKRKLAWRQGVLVYSGESLAEVINDVNRYTDIQIEIADPELNDKPVAGYFRVTRIEALFQSLELNFGIRVERINETHVRLSLAR